MNNDVQGMSLDIEHVGFLTSMDSKVINIITNNLMLIKQALIHYFEYIISVIFLFSGYFNIGWNNKKQHWRKELAGIVVIVPKNKELKTIKFNHSISKKAYSSRVGFLF